MFICIILSIIITALVVHFCYKSMKPVSEASDAAKYMDSEVKLSIETDKFIRTEKKRKKDD
ncbi:MAG: hypothetical protein IJU87_09190 [Lachnospiraceae bacterium]|nr:hypothetical protein [Lachnospiraceae bacterium]